MIQGYRMAGPPPRGGPPAAQPSETAWPVWLGFVTLLAVFVVANLAFAILLGASGADPGKPPAWVDLSSAVILEAGLVAGALLAAKLIKPLHAWQFGLRPTRWGPAVGWTLLALAAFFAFVLLWSALINPPEQTTADDLGVKESNLALISAGVIFVVLAPIAEELFFRGLFYGSLRTRLPVGWAALICGAVFGAIHAPTGLSAVPALVVFGIVLCLVRERTGSLYPCVALHALNNMVAYWGLTNVTPGVAVGMAAFTVAGCSLVPRFAWRRPPLPQTT
jgi:membrane protease YdiL (CAAX protease family)